MQSNVYYPPLSSILNIDSLPEQLSFVKDGLENLLDDIFIDSYQVINNESSNMTSYSVCLKLFKKASIEIPYASVRILSRSIWIMEFIITAHVANLMFFY